MPTLQIRDVPEDLHEALRFRAQRAHRSLAQQALIELRGIDKLSGANKRRETLAAIRQRLTQANPTELDAPEALIREDRER